MSETAADKFGDKLTNESVEAPSSNKTDSSSFELFIKNNDRPRIQSENNKIVLSKKNDLLRNTRSITALPFGINVNKEYEKRLLPSQRAKWRHVYTVEAAKERIRKQSEVISFIIINVLFNYIIIRITTTNYCRRK